METFENVSQITFLSNEISYLRNKVNNLKDERVSLQIDGFCAEKDSCEQCRNARKNSTEYMALLHRELKIESKIKNIKKRIDYLRCDEKYLIWKYGGATMEGSENLIKLFD